MTFLLGLVVRCVGIYVALRWEDVHQSEGSRFEEDMKARRVGSFDVIDRVEEGPPAVEVEVSKNRSGLRPPYDWREEEGGPVLSSRWGRRPASREPVVRPRESGPVLSSSVPLTPEEIVKLRTRWREDVAARWRRSVGEVEELDS